LLIPRANSCSQPTYEELKLQSDIVFDIAKSRSQPTYEELKRDVSGYLEVCRPGGSQPTYEELKPRLLRGLATRLFGSQPTYEELKPQSGQTRSPNSAWFSAYL